MAGEDAVGRGGRRVAVPRVVVLLGHVPGAAIGGARQAPVVAGRAVPHPGEVDEVHVEPVVAAVDRDVAVVERRAEAEGLVGLEHLVVDRADLLDEVGHARGVVVGRGHRVEAVSREVDAEPPAGRRVRLDDLARLEVELEAGAGIVGADQGRGAGAVDRGDVVRRRGGAAGGEERERRRPPHRNAQRTW